MLQSSLLHTLGRLFYLCYELCTVNCYVTRHDNKSFHNGEFSEFFPQLSRKFSSTIPQAVFGICRRLHLPSQPSQDFQRCMTCQHRHSRHLRNIDSFIFHRLRLGFADHCSPFSRPSILASRLFLIQSIHDRSDDGIRRRARDCL
jgi:hypothetical protein